MIINRIKDLPDEVLKKYYLDNKLDDKLEKTHKDICENLKLSLESRCNLKRISIELFGSSVNGFGTKDCDLDMSITFPTLLQMGIHIPFHNDFDYYGRRRRNRTPKSFRKLIPASVQVLNEKLKGSPNITNPVPVPDAKVPIVKFKYHVANNSSFDCDISFENNIGVSSGKLLKAYSQIDDAVPILGIFIKKWAKSSGICDPQHLSSFAWILMVIHYLQEVHVVPYLQDIREHPDIKIHRYDNIISHADIENVNLYFKQTNEWSLSKLLVGFYNYFANEYSYQNIIHIQKVEPARLGRHDFFGHPIPNTDACVRYPCHARGKKKKTMKYSEKVDHELIKDAMKYAHSKLVDDDSWKRLDGNELLQFLTPTSAAYSTHARPEEPKITADELVKKDPDVSHRNTETKILDVKKKRVRKRPNYVRMEISEIDPSLFR